MSASLILSTPVASTVEALGWTLLHFVWQGAVVALALSVFLFLARKASPQVRYLAGCGAICLMCIAAISTFVWYFGAARVGTAASPAVAPADSATLSAVSSSGVLPPARTTTADLRTNARETTEAPTVAHSARVEEPPTASQVPVVSVEFLKSLPEAAARWRQRLEPWLPGVVALWALGVAFLSLRLLVGWRAVRRLRATAQEIPEELWNSRFSRLKGRLGVSYPVRLACSASAGVPMVIGWLKPAVILPAGLITGLSGEQLEAILAHELIHIRRHDYLVNLLQNVVETIFFYHPAVAWVSGRIRVEREHCCDDAALVACGGVLDYARALAALAELRRRPALGVAATGGSLVERIRRLGNTAEMSARRGISPVFPTLALLFAAICALAAIAHAAMAQHTGDLTKPSASAKGGAIKDLPSKEQAGDAVTIRGRVLRPDGEPAAGAQILALRTFWSSRVSWRPVATALAGANGEFEIRVPPRWYDGLGSTFAWLAARADGFGVEWARGPSFVAGKEPSSPVVLRLVPESPIHGRVVDLEGRPVSGVRVRVVAQAVPREGQDLGPWLDALKKGLTSADRQLGGRLPGYEEEATPPILSDQDGRFVVRGIGRERMMRLQVSGETIASEQFEVVTRSMKPLAPPPGSNGHTEVFGEDFTYQAAPTKPIGGTVRDAVTGKPLAGVHLELRRHNFVVTQTDAEGTFRLVGMPKQTDANEKEGIPNRLVAVPNVDQPYFDNWVDIPQTAGLEPVRLDIKLRRGLWITGRVTDKVTGKPLSATVHYFPYASNQFVNKDEWRNFERVNDEPHRVTRPDGTYGIVGLPGRAIVGVRAGGGMYLKGVGASEIPGMDKNGRFPTTLGSANAGFEHALKEINPPPGAESVACDLALDPGGKVRITFVDGAGKPVEDTFLLHLEPGVAVAAARPDSTFEIAGLAPKESRTYQITQWQRKIAKLFSFDYDDKASHPLTITLEPCATVRGRLLDEEGRPVKNVQVFASAEQNGSERFTLYPFGPITDADGRFVIENLAAGCDSYKISAMHPQLDPPTVAEKVAFAPGRTIDLGDIKLRWPR
ncbi:MAG TPA: M56 family metallopeptidase [Planctomycetaceae bacterium]|jgi:beta-lactamase regulating signal transducer with metallopeptidase domain|nr:M56 family metallopeptidase [Planctomycetaceae bacterium]